MIIDMAMAHHPSSSVETDTKQLLSNGAEPVSDTRVATGSASAVASGPASVSHEKFVHHVLTTHHGVLGWDPVRQRQRQRQRQIRKRTGGSASWKLMCMTW